MSEIALIGKKIGMTREFYKSGQLVPVTVLKMEKARVIHVIEEEKRGYKAVQLGYGKIKASKSEKGESTTSENLGQATILTVLLLMIILPVLAYYVLMEMAQGFAG